MADKIELNEELLGTISGGTAQEIAELKEAILANPKLAGEWESCARYLKDHFAPRLYPFK